jgi:lysophospholipase L1-like esterase
VFYFGFEADSTPGGSDPGISLVDMRFVSVIWVRTLSVICYDDGMRILVFGDSIAYGSWAAEYGWVELIKREAHKRTVESKGSTKLQVLNQAIGSDCSSKILQRMECEIKSRYSASWPFVFIFSFGTNDERTLDGTVETSIEQFEENIKAIIRTARVYTDRILFVGSPPIGQPDAVFKGQEYSDERLKTYEERLRSVVQAENIPFVPIRPVFEQAGPDGLYSYDHLHPNDAGHMLIAAAVLPELDKLLSSTTAR